MSLSDFLFNGQPPPSVTTYGQTTANIPTWMADYTQGLLSRANAVAGEPYQTYQGPRVAGFAPETEDAFDAVRANVGKFTPNVTAALGMATDAGNPGSMAAASPYINQAGQQFQGANVDRYMDPYVGNVIDRATQVANRNFNEKIMPGLTGKFTAAGQYGSSAHQREANQSARDLTEGLQTNAGAMLSGAYTNAGQMFTSDANRSGALANTVGDIANQEAAAKLAASGQVGTLAQMGQGMETRDAAALDTVGRARQDQAQRNLDTAYGDFQEQRNYPRSTIDWMSSVIRGMPAPVSTTTQQTAPMAGANYRPSGLEQLAQIYTASQAGRNSGE